MCVQMGRGSLRFGGGCLEQDKKVHNKNLGSCLERGKDGQEGTLNEAANRRSKC